MSERPLIPIDNSQIPDDAVLRNVTMGEVRAVAAASQPPSGDLIAALDVYMVAAQRFARGAISGDEFDAATEALMEAREQVSQPPSGDARCPDCRMTAHDIGMVHIHAQIAAAGQGAADPPPSGDALREALRAFGERLAADGYGWEAIITRETPSGEQTVAHLTTANPDPEALATPAPLDVERLIEALSIEWTDFWVEGPRGIDGSHEVTFDLRRFGHEVARAYAEQEGGDCQHGIPRNECKLAEHDR